MSSSRHLRCLAPAAAFRRAASRRSERGAAFVESIIVISALSLGLLGIAFFRDLYEKKLGVMRLARAAAVAHSMVGCKESQHREWLGRDLGRYGTTNPEQQGQPAHSTNAGGPASGAADDGGRTTRLLDKTGAVSGDGEGLLNPITSAELSGESRVDSGGGLSAPRRPAFEAHVQSRSFVTCGEEIKESDYDRVLDMVKDEALALFHSE